MQRYAYIYALRGYAILGVMMVHASQPFAALPKSLLAFTGQGARGVQLFFVVSAFTLMLSWEQRRDGAAPFFVRRFFRIAPMFWLAILFFVSLEGFAPRHWAPNGIGWSHVVATAAFLHGWQPETITSVVPGGWSISVEMLFYALFPLIALWLTTWRRAALAFAASALLAPAVNALPALIWPSEEAYLTQAFAYMWFPNQFAAFVAGVLAFRLSREVSMPRVMSETLIAAGVAALAVLPFVQIRGVHAVPVYAAIFGAIALGCAHDSGHWLLSRHVQFIGKVSYSGYLWHFAILALLGATGLASLGAGATSYLLFFVALAISTTALSAVTYRCIERPGIEAGRRLAESIARGRPSAQPPDSPSAAVSLGAARAGGVLGIGPAAYQTGGRD